MRARHSGRLRIALASATLLGTGALLTAAAFTDYADQHVVLDGSMNTFDIVAAGSPEPGWTPTDVAWVQGNPEAYRIKLTADDSGYVMAPGSSLDLRVAVKNASPRLAGEITISILDPEPHGDAVDPDTGLYVDLWDQLVFTVRHGSDLLYDQVKAPDLTPYTWETSLNPGEYRMLDVTIHLPAEVDNRWQLASTGVLFHFEAVNA